MTQTAQQSQHRCKHRALIDAIYSEAGAGQISRQKHGHTHRPDHADTQRHTHTDTTTIRGRDATFARYLWYVSTDATIFGCVFCLYILCMLHVNIHIQRETHTCHSQVKVVLSSHKVHALSTVSIRARASVGSSGFPPCSYGSHFLLNVVESSTVHCPGLLAPPPFATAASRDAGCALAPSTAAGSRSINAKPRLKEGICVCVGVGV